MRPIAEQIFVAGSRGRKTPLWCSILEPCERSVIERVVCHGSRGPLKDQNCKLTYGSCALRRWPSPQHGMKGTRASHRLPVRQRHPLSLGPCPHSLPTGAQTTKRRRGDDEERGAP
ncbi:hypothetical protein PAMP_011095 [Pampus punctatissimus]